MLNPRKHTSESIDCGSCHLAPDIAVFVERTQKLSLDPDERFTTQYSVDATRPITPPS